MLLSDVDISFAVHFGQLKVEPETPGSMQPSSVDLRLDKTFRVVVSDTSNAASSGTDSSVLFREVTVPKGEKFVLAPGEFALANTYEAVTLGDSFAARVEGKSSLGRNGQSIHVTAGFIDPGFSGQIVLELYNHLPVPFEYEPGQKIAQLCLFELSRPPAATYGSTTAGSHYQNQTGPQPSRSHINYDTIDVYKEQP